MCFHSCRDNPCVVLLHVILFPLLSPVCHISMSVYPQSPESISRVLVWVSEWMCNFLISWASCLVLLLLCHKFDYVLSTLIPSCVYIVCFAHCSWSHPRLTFPLFSKFFTFLVQVLIFKSYCILSSVLYLSPSTLAHTQRNMTLANMTITKLSFKLTESYNSIPSIT